MKRIALIILMLTIISKLVGFIRDIILSFFYGATNISDAYLISLMIPGEIFALIGVAIATTYIPIYSDIQNKLSTKEANKYTNNVINLIMFISTAIVFVAMLYTEPIVKIFASGFEGETLSLAIGLTRISIVCVYFIGLVKVFSGFLQINGKFSIPALMALPMNGFIIISIYISYYYNNVYLLAIGSLVGFLSQLIILLPFVYIKGFRYKFFLDIKDKHIKNMAYIALPVMLGESVNQISVIVDKTIASHIIVGGISILTYSDRIIQFIQAVFVISIVTAIYPSISKMASESNIKGLKNYVSGALRGVILLVVPLSIGVMLFSYQIIELLYGRGAFNTEAIKMTSISLFYYSIGMIGFGLREVLSKAFFSLQDTKTPMINAAIAVVVDIVLNLILSRFLGVGGLALATSISAIVAAILLYISLRKKIGSFQTNNIKFFIKVLYASILMGVIAKISYFYLINIINVYISLILSAIVGLLIYTIAIYLMKIEDVKILLKTFRNKVLK